MLDMYTDRFHSPTRLTSLLIRAPRWWNRHRAGRLAIALSACMACVPMVSEAQGQAVQRRAPESRPQIQLSFAPLVKKSAPAVVNIYTQKTLTQPISPLFSDPFFRKFFGDSFGIPQTTREENSLGSGVIVDPQGLVVTAHHVIKDADEITVVLPNRQELAARVVVADERTDLAVLRVEGTQSGLPSISLSDSDDVQVGDLVLAIGNPFGVGQTVTSGIVSALARTNVGVSDFNFFIQTDAAINPGNSGGALIGLDGKLIGINTAIYSRTGASNGIGFAVPSNMVRVVLRSVGVGKVMRPWIGVIGQDLTGDLARSIGRDRSGGVIVASIDADGPAGRAGLRVGDVILAINGREVEGRRALAFRLATQELGSNARVDIWRNGQKMVVSLRLMAPPELPPRQETRVKGKNPLNGALIASLSPALADEMGLDTLRRGVIVLSLLRGSTSHRLGFRPGDIVLRGGRQDIELVDELLEYLNKKVSGTWDITIQRGERVLTTRFRP